MRLIDLFKKKIAYQLLAAILLLVILSLASIFVIYQTLQLSLQTQENLTSTTLPISRLSQRLSYEATSFLETVESTYSLSKASEPKEAPSQQEASKRILATIDEIDQLSSQKFSITEIKQLVSQILKNNEVLEEIWCLDRLSILDQFSDEKAQALGSIAALNKSVKRYKFLTENISAGTQSYLVEYQDHLAKLDLLMKRTGFEITEQQNKQDRNDYVNGIRKIALLNIELSPSTVSKVMAETGQELLNQFSQPRNMFDLIDEWKLQEREVIRLLSDIKQLQSSLAAELDKLLNLSNENATTEVSLLNDQMKQSNQIVFLTVAFIIVGALLLVFAFIIPKITNRLKLLNENTAYISQGIFDREIDTKGNDELGTLAKTLADFRQSLIEQDKSTAMIKALLEVTHNGILVTDPSQSPVAQNSTAMALFSLPKATANEGNVHEKIAEQFIPGSGYKDKVDAWYDQTQGGFQYIFQMNDGRFVEVYASSFESSGSTFKVFSFTDVSDHLESQIELEDAKNAAESSTRAKSEFLAVMSHEIRTPMNGVIGMLNLLLDTVLSEEQEQKANLALGSAKSLLSLINDILDFSKIEAGKLDLDYLDFDLTAMLSDLVESLAPLAEQKGIELIIDTHGLDSHIIEADAGRIRQIFANVLSNAIKFTETGHVLLVVSSRALAAGRVCIEAQIVDTGCGFDSSLQEKVFDNFTQVDSSNKRQHGGTGLGLAITRRLCQMMGGNITASSQPGMGSTFSLNIEVSVRRLVDLVEPQGAGIELWLLGGSALQAEIVIKQVEAWGAHCRYFTGKGDLDSVLMGVDTTKPDLVIVDSRLSQEAENKQWLTLFEGVPLICVSNFTETKDNLPFGPDAYTRTILRPITRRDLESTLRVLELDVTDSGSVQSSELGNQDLEPAADKTSRITALLVEDNQVNQMVAKAMLEQLDLNVEIVSNGQEALDILVEQQNRVFDVIFMDCQMPVMDGYEASERIRRSEAGQRYAGVPIIALTANAMRGDKEKCLAAGMDDYVPKPIEKADIAEALERLSLSFAKV